MQPAATEQLLDAFARSLPTDPVTALATCRAAGVPVSALSSVPSTLATSSRWADAVAADHDRARRISAATDVLLTCLEGIPEVAIAGDSLGPAWSKDLDVFVTPRSLSAASAALAAGGLVPMDRLRDRLRGRRRRQEPSRYFVVEAGGEVLAAVELRERLWDAGEPSADAVQRAGRSGPVATLRPDDAARRRIGKHASSPQPTVRGAIELTAVADRGELPADRMLERAARRHAAIEAALIGEGPLQAIAARRTLEVDDRATRASQLARARRRLRRAMRRTQVRVAFCGIDGSGKSTQVDRLVENLGRANVDARREWVRIGNKSSALVERVARAGQRLLPRESHSFQAAREAAGRSGTASRIEPPATRRGVLGWSWAMAVTIDYLIRSWASLWRGSGAVVVLDRSLPDALVELEDDYGVALRLTAQRWLLKRLGPTPDITFHITLPGAVAKARKDDVFTAEELDLQQERYQRLLAGRDDVVTLDGQRSPAELASDVLRAVCAGPSRAPRWRHRARARAASHGGRG